ncbi:MAG: hypothetical protein K1Y01_17315 [Vicinamibacteria bacterium]|nr:hypothetical protein [Vicinamibacteria bacterium]
MRFDSVVLADSASLAALSCFSRLRSERDAGARSLLLALDDASGAAAIEARGLGRVLRFEEVEEDATAASQPWRERFAVVIRRLRPKHVMAPLGLIAAPLAVDYFKILRSVLSVDPGRDLLFFEERPHCLVAEAVRLRLASLGVRLPPVTRLRSPRGYGAFALRLLSGIGVPPIFGGLRERSRLASTLKSSFKEAADWDPQRALGPKLQPVIEPWTDGDSADLFSLASELGLEARLGSKKAFRRRMARHAAGGGSRSPIERYWLSLPSPAEADPVSDPC